VVGLDQPVEVSVVTPVVADDRPGLEDTLVVVQAVAGGQGPEEPGETVGVPTAL